MNSEELILLDKFYELLGKDSIKSKITLIKPESNILNKKTYLLNFNELNNKLNRINLPNNITFENYIKNELNTTGSINGENQLVLNGIFKNFKFENIIKNYCVNYIQCSFCKGGNTTIEKDKKLNYINCKSCKSIKYI